MYYSVRLWGFNKMEEPEYAEDLKGLARQCPKCKIIAHYTVEGRNPVDVECPDCSHEFIVQKYKKGEIPKSL